MPSDEWLTVETAAQRIGRSKRTIYRWVEQGSVRTMRPMMVLWVHFPDVVSAEGAMIRRERKARPKWP